MSLYGAIFRPLNESEIGKVINNATLGQKVEELSSGYMIRPSDIIAWPFQKIAFSLFNLYENQESKLEKWNFNNQWNADAVEFKSVGCFLSSLAFYFCATLTRHVPHSIENLILGQRGDSNIAERWYLKTSLPFLYTLDRISVSEHDKLKRRLEVV